MRYKLSGMYLKDYIKILAVRKFKNIGLDKRTWVTERNA
jgi:hypothetical protein